MREAHTSAGSAGPKLTQKLTLGLVMGLALSLSLWGCTASANWSFFQGVQVSSGSASTTYANGQIQLNWQRTADNQIQVNGNLNFELAQVYLRLMRNRAVVHQETVKPNAERTFSAVLPDPQFADQICVESDCFDL